MPLRSFKKHFTLREGRKENKKQECYGKYEKEGSGFCLRCEDLEECQGEYFKRLHKRERFFGKRGRKENE